MQEWLKQRHIVGLTRNVLQKLWITSRHTPGRACCSVTAQEFRRDNEVYNQANWKEPYIKFPHYRDVLYCLSIITSTAILLLLSIIWKDKQMYSGWKDRQMYSASKFCISSYHDKSNIAAIVGQNRFLVFYICKYYSILSAGLKTRSSYSTFTTRARKQRFYFKG